LLATFFLVVGSLVVFVFGAAFFLVALVLAVAFFFTAVGFFLVTFFFAMELLQSVGVA
jgi:hypothetical protein